MVVRGVGRKYAEIIRIVGGAELFPPRNRTINQVITQHVQNRNHADNSPEQIRAHSECDTHQQSRIGASENCQPLGIASLRSDEPLSGRDKIAVSRRPLLPPTCITPSFSEFSAATDQRQREEAASLHEKRYENTELRIHGHCESAIR